MIINPQTTKVQWPEILDDQEIDRMLASASPNSNAEVDCDCDCDCSEED